MAKTPVDEYGDEFAEAFAMRGEIWERLFRNDAPIEIAYDLEIALSDLFGVVRLLNRTTAINPMPIPWGLSRM